MQYLIIKDYFVKGRHIWLHRLTLLFFRFIFYPDLFIVYFRGQLLVLAPWHPRLEHNWNPTCHRLFQSSIDINMILHQRYSNLWQPFGMLWLLILQRQWVAFVFFLGVWLIVSTWHLYYAFEASCSVCSKKKVGLLIPVQTMLFHWDWNIQDMQIKALICICESNMNILISIYRVFFSLSVIKDMIFMNAKQIVPRLCNSQTILWNKLKVFSWWNYFR